MWDVEFLQCIIERHLHRIFGRLVCTCCLGHGPCWHCHNKLNALQIDAPTNLLGECHVAEPRRMLHTAVWKKIKGKQMVGVDEIKPLLMGRPISAKRHVHRTYTFSVIKTNTTGFLIQDIRCVGMCGICLGRHCQGEVCMTSYTIQVSQYCVIMQWRLQIDQISCDDQGCLPGLWIPGGVPKTPLSGRIHM